MRCVVVTGAGRQRSASAPTARPWPGTPSGAATTPGSPAELATPGYGVRPEWDHDFAWHFGLRVPVIARVNGACAGVGLVLACYCDLRVAVGDAKLTTATPQLGLPAEYGLSWLLPRLIGATHAADLLLTGRIVTAAEPVVAGLFNGVVATAAELDDAVGRLRPALRHRRVAGGRHRRPSASSGATCSRPTSAPVGRAVAGADRRADGRRRLPRGRGRPAGEAPAALLAAAASDVGSAIVRAELGEDLGGVLARRRAPGPGSWPWPSKSTGDATARYGASPSTTGMSTKAPAAMACGSTTASAIVFTGDHHTSWRSNASAHSSRVRVRNTSSSSATSASLFLARSGDRRSAGRRPGPAARWRPAARASGGPAPGR